MGTSHDNSGYSSGWSFLLINIIHHRLLKAYGLAYISVTAPKLLSLLLVLYRRKSARVKIYSSVSATRQIVRRLAPELLVFGFNCCSILKGRSRHIERRADTGLCYRYTLSSQDLSLCVTIPPSVQHWQVASHS